MYISDNAVPIIVGKNIQRCRILRGWSQTQLANEAEMDRADISRYENGSREMKITALYRVADALQVDMDQAIVIEEKLFGSCFETRDQKEGMNAFLEKRKVDAFLNK